MKEVPECPAESSLLIDLENSRLGIIVDVQLVLNEAEHGEKIECDSDTTCPFVKSPMGSLQLRSVAGIIALLIV